MEKRIVRHGQEAVTVTAKKNYKNLAVNAFSASSMVALIAFMATSVDYDSINPSDAHDYLPEDTATDPNITSTPHASPMRVHFDEHAALEPIPPQLESDINLSQLEQDFFFDDHGNERGTFEFAYTRLKETAPDRHQWAYEIAEHARDVGVHPLPLMLIMTKEVGLNENYTIGTKDAQGPFQMQALWFIENVQKYAELTPFYQNLSANDADRIALDQILNDDSLKDNDIRRTRASQIATMFAAKDSVSNPADWDFSELRFNGEFVAQLMGHVVKNDFPELAIENLPDNAKDAADLIMDRTTRYYATHMTGRAGSDYIWYLSKNHPDITYNQTGVISGIIEELNNENSARWPKVKPSTLMAILESNPGAFPDKENTLAASAPQSFAMYVERQTAMVIEPLQPIIAVTSPDYGQSYDDFKLATLGGNEHPDALDRLNQMTILTSSLRPMARPSEILQLAAAVTSPTIVEKTIRPEARPDIMRVSYNHP